MEGKILLPLDGSETAETAIPHAIMMAHSTASKIVLLRCVDITYYVGFTSLATYSMSAEVWAAEQEAAQEYLQTVAARPDLKDLVVQTTVGGGYAANEILNYVAEHDDITMIAMATHGRGGLGRWLLGSVAEKVLHGATVPLLLVRPAHMGKRIVPPTARPYGNILVTLDGWPLAEAALDPAVTLALATRAKITLLSVVPQPQASEVSRVWNDVDFETSSRREYLDRIAARLEQQGIVVGTRLDHGDPAEVILAACEELAPDLLVMATHGKSGLQRLWLGSVAMRVAASAQRPVVLVRPQEREQASAANGGARQAHPAAVLPR